MALKEDVTSVLTRIRAGEPEASEELLPLVYDELHALAHRYMRDERVGHTLQTTALVHEAFLRMGGDEPSSPADRAHYMRIAARAMRRVLIDHARKKRSEKRGGQRRREPLDEAQVFLGEPSVDLLVLDEALDRLAELDPDLAQVVELRFFAGLTAEETAENLGVSVRKVMYDWRLARAWLKQRME